MNFNVVCFIALILVILVFTENLRALMIRLYLHNYIDASEFTFVRELYSSVIIHDNVRLWSLITFRFLVKDHI